MGKVQPQGDVVPEGEGKLSQAITLRMPKKLLERVERCAKDTANNRSDTVLHLLRWALGAYEASRAEHEKGKTA
jgi:metal-responsive CopG/Arc/MetJ family transcriptional regulator